MIKSKAYGAILLLLIISSCQSRLQDAQDVNEQRNLANQETTLFTDDFEEQLDPFWGIQVADDSRAIIVQDPLQKSNKALKVALQPTDFVSGGNRSELVVKQHDSMGYLNRYSFRFMLPSQFFTEQEQEGWFIIHQWHDEPPAGFTWQTKKHSTKPPIALTISYTPSKGYQLYYKDGLDTGNLDEAKRLVWPERLKPDVWYTFSNQVHWSMYATHGYSQPRLNGEMFKEANNVHPGNSEKIIGRNMYNAVGNYFKFGLYQGKGQTVIRHIYLDDFTMEAKRISYWHK